MNFLFCNVVLRMLSRYINIASSLFLLFPTLYISQSSSCLRSFQLYQSHYIIIHSDLLQVKMRNISKQNGWVIYYEEVCSFAQNIEYHV